uniref:SCD domain-containing protein n=1 Tax=Eptatretus burgeri TaxID=7764 RepID=A0A8C4WZS6_EPTBU
MYSPFTFLIFLTKAFLWNLEMKWKLISTQFYLFSYLLMVFFFPQKFNVSTSKVIVHFCFSDILPEIRAICLEELCCWMTSCPDTFLTDSYLKYLGWTLSDRQADVRKRCVSSLLVLYSKPEQQPRLELFSQRFKERLVTMVSDREPDVAVKTVQVLNAMRETSDGLLSRKDCEAVYPYVFCARRQLAVAAGSFLYKSLLKQESEMESSPPSRPQEGFLRALLAFHLANQVVHSYLIFLIFHY